MLQVAEEGARKRIASWPDGTFRAVAFADGLGSEVGLVRSAYLTLTKRDDELVLDFTGTSPENTSPYNAHIQAAVGHLSNYLYSYVFYDLPISSATFAPIEVRIPEGTVLNPSERAATSNSVMVCTGVMATAPNAFAKILFATQDWQRVTAAAANSGNGHIIAGQSQWGLPFADLLAYQLNTDGQGGRPNAAGMDASHFAWCPFGRAPDVELMENEFPMLIPISQHWVDSCGHGKHRGGCGTVQIWVAHQVPQVFFESIADNSKIQTPQPLFGGYGSATVPGISVRGPDLMQRLREDPGGLNLDLTTLLEEGAVQGQWQVEFLGRPARPYDEGDVITFAFSGGGAGYGDPLDAEPDGVVSDIIRGAVSEWSARNVYQVAYDPESFRVDHERTQELREAERQARLERGKPWEDFQAEWSEKRPPEEILQWYGSWPDAEQTEPVMRM
jgi:N-methylhydantoinase B/oxoprolinase/acetone carboxylase alpha subunit